MSRSAWSRLDRLERMAAEARHALDPVAVVTDEDGKVVKALLPDGQVVAVHPGLELEGLPQSVKVYLFDPDCA